jgi:hypothetical protein
MNSNIYLETYEVNFLNFKAHNRDLPADIKKEVGGDFGKLLRALAEGGRPANHGYDIDLMRKEAKALYEVSLFS